MRHGLVPQIGERSESFGETMERIYLFPDIQAMETALSSWLGIEFENEYGENVELCSLEITLPDTFPTYSPEVEWEICCYQTIPPEYIQYFKEE